MTTEEDQRVLNKLRELDVARQRTGAVNELSRALGVLTESVVSGPVNMRALLGHVSAAMVFLGVEVDMDGCVGDRRAVHVALRTRGATHPNTD